MKLKIIWTLVKQVYAQLLRPILLKAVDDPDAVWDDYLMKAIDNLFEYDGNG
jgi:hypothetical protein